MSREGWLYFSDRPVGVDADLLWRDPGASVSAQVRDVAERLTRPLSGGGASAAADSDSMTFAIHAEWGCGKSSLLRMIAETATELAGQAADRLVVCNYVASAYAGVDADIRSTLAMRALSSLAGSTVRALRLFEEAAMSTVGELPADPATAPVKVDQTLRRISYELARVIDFPELLAREIRGDGQTGEPNGSRVLAVLIDDLDRCSPALVSEVLDLTQQWGTVPHLYFVLALDHQALRQALLFRAQKDGGSVVDPDHALEKYVQHTITLPPLDGPRLQEYVKRLLDQYVDDGVSHAISTHVRLLETGLRIKTPRAVKRCLNTIRPDIRHALDQGEDPARVIKRRVLQYSWRDVYERFLLPAIQGASNAQSAWRDLESACLAYIREGERDDEKLDFLTARLRPRLRDEFFAAPLPRNLVRYIAERPFLYYEDDPDERGDLASQVPTIDLDSVLGSDNSEARFMAEYYEARTANQAEDRRGTLSHALGAYKAAGERGAKISSENASQVGNLALWAEKFGAYDFSEALFEMALAMQPGHANNVMNYASFLADHREPRLGDAEALLEQLRTRHPSHKPDRRMLLEAQVARLRGEVVAWSDEQREGLLDAVRSEPEDEDTAYMRAMTAAKEFSDPSLAREVLEASLFSCKGMEPAYRRIRAFADFMAERRDDREGRDEAMEIYRRLLERPWCVPTGDSPPIQSNYAVLLYTNDWDEEAGRLWFASYGADSSLRPTRSTYGQYLGNVGRSDLAARVLKGQPIDEQVLGRNHQPLPPAFSDSALVERAFAHIDALNHGGEAGSPAPPAEEPSNPPPARRRSRTRKT